MDNTFEKLLHASLRKNFKILRNKAQIFLSLHKRVRLLKIHFLKKYIILNIRSTFIGVIIAIFTTQTFAKDEQLIFQHISVKHGLAVTTALSIVQDNKGFLWIATIDGLHRYDGYKFTIYRNVYGDSSSISGNEISTLYKSNTGELWIGTYNTGLNKYDSRTGKFKRFLNIPGDPHSLSHNRVWSICEDDHGMIWIGTEAGLNKYDTATNNFTRYFHQDDNLNSLTNNNVLTIKKDKSGTLWIGTVDGLNMLSPHLAPRGNLGGASFIRYKNIQGNSNSLSDNIVFSIFEDHKGTLWIGTVDGLNRLDSPSLAPSPPLIPPKGGQKRGGTGNPTAPAGKSDGKAPLPGLSRTFGREGVEGASPFTVFKFDHVGGIARGKTHKESKKDSRQSFSYLNRYGDNAIRDIYEDRSGKLWLATDRGLKIFDPQTKYYIVYNNELKNTYSLSGDLVRCFYEDRSHNLWVGTAASGMNRIDLKPQKFVLYQKEFNNPYSLSDNNIRSIYEDTYGRVWIGTMGGGLNILDVNSGKFLRFQKILKDPKFSFDAKNIWSIYEDKAGFIWIGSSIGLYQCDANLNKFKHFTHDPKDPNSLSENTIRSILRDSKGNVWIGTEGGLNKYIYKTQKLIRYTPCSNDKNCLSDKTVWVIREYPEGVLWIGTGNGLNKVILENKKSDHTIFQHFKTEINNKNSISHNSVRTIYVDKKAAILWIGTNDGLNKYDPKTGIFIRYNKEEGLPNGNVYGILSDDEGNLWISHNKGLSQFNIETEKFRNFDIHDGLQNNEFNTGAYYKNSKGVMFFGGPNGFNRFHPKNVNANPYVPPIVITSIKVMGEDFNQNIEISEIKQIKIHYFKKVLIFEFASLDYTFPGKNQYAYMLEGFDKDWINAGTRRFVTYTNLDPGKYTLKIIASNNDGVWNKTGTKLHITIIPPFWKTTWFYVVCILIVISSVYTFYKIRIRNLKIAERILIEQVTLKTKQLRKEKDKVEQQNIIIAKNNQNITNSIRYAEKIQKEILLDKDTIHSIFHDSFILFKPKEIVSGDFYWFTKKNEKVIIAAVDCTGHGVPGAFLSLIGSIFLNEIINEKGIVEPSLILDQLNIKVKQALHYGEKNSFIDNDQKKYHMTEGMDVALVTLDMNTYHLSFSGAKRPLYIISDSNLNETKGDTQTVGSVLRTANKNFTNHQIQLKKSDTFYLFSDGFIDQFGGTKDDKIMTEGFKKILLDIQHLSMKEQEIVLDSTFQEWKGKNNQIDDILVIGVKV